MGTVTSKRSSWPWPENLYRRLRFCPPTTMPNGCIEFAGGKNSDGYGIVWNGQRQVPAHRASYELLVGSIAEGLEIDHLCRNVACVNPGHLEPVTHLENVRRGLRNLKGVCSKGHAIEGDNLYLNVKSGQRVCKECRRTYDRKRRERERRERSQ